jgi:hypothetical protein
VFSAYELWFKQIIYEIDSIRDIFMGSEKLQQFSLMSLTAETLKPEAPSLDERVMLDINKRFETLRKTKLKTLFLNMFSMFLNPNIFFQFEL